MISKLASVKILSPNHSGKRIMPVDRITPHCFVGQVTAKRGCEVFLPKTKKASANYVIGKDGDIGCSVDEVNRSWCSSSNANDQRAITIEVASDNYHPYAVTNKAWDALVDLCTDICRRYNKDCLLWLPDKAISLSYTPKPDEMVLTVHRWFAAKACPGDYIYGRLKELADTVTARLKGNPEPEKPLYRVQVGAFSEKRNALLMADKLRAQGYQCIIKEETK